MQILKDEIRNRILAVAEDTFYRKGFRESTTREIAEVAGIRVSNLYLYYENKEAIFHGVADGFYNYILKGLETFLDHRDRSMPADLGISRHIQQMISADHRKFVILTDKSQGTRYEGFKKQITDILHRHIQSQVETDRDELIFYVLARNFIEGVIEIAKNYKDDHWLESNIDMLVRYHMKGMEPFM